MNDTVVPPLYVCHLLGGPGPFHVSNPGEALVYLNRPAAAIALTNYFHHAPGWRIVPVFCE